MLACLDACAADDVDCRAECIAVRLPLPSHPPPPPINANNSPSQVPNPDQVAVNATNACVSACPQGNGTATENDAYRDCLIDCIDKYYFTTTGTPANPTAGPSGTGVVASPSSSPTGSGDVRPSSSGSVSGTPTGTGGPAAATNTNAAGGLVRVGTMGVGLVGFFAAVLAL